MTTGKHIILIVIFVSLIILALIVEDWRDVKVVGFMAGVFVLGRILRNGIK